MMYQYEYYFQKYYTFICSIRHLQMHFQQKRTKRSITTTDKASSTSSKKVFDPQLQSFTKQRLKFDGLNNKQNSKQEELSVDRLVEIILLALDHYYSLDRSSFFSSCKQFLSKTHNSCWKLKIIQRLNTYEYLQQAIRHKPYSDIQVQIMKQWRKNYLLFAVTTFWYSAMQKTSFTIMKDFTREYDTFKEFIAQISFFIFKGWFVRLQKKQVAVLDKLSDQTSHFIITDSSQFKKLYQKIIVPLTQNQSRGKSINWKLDLKAQKIKKCVYDQTRELNLPKTIEVLRKFAKQSRILKKIQLLRQYRETLNSQLIQNQRLLIQNKQQKEYQILEKDDFITAIVFCIISGQIKEIRASMIYLQSILGQNLWLLSQMRVDPYAIDIIAALCYLTQNNIQEQVPQNHIRNNGLRITSMPNIVDKFMEALQSPNFVIKHITSFQEY